MLQKKEWAVHPHRLNEIDAELADYPEILRQLLFTRGFATKAAAKDFLELEYKNLHDPFLLKDMAKAVARILAAITAGEKILVFADYDADGVPAAVVLTEFFRQIKFTNFSVYIPDRHEEEHGLSLEVVGQAAKDGVNLIITVDCGITNVAEVARANKLGVDVIITDHHLPGAKLPKAVAVVDPKRADDEYPFKGLAGTGVAFKLVQALVIRWNEKAPTLSSATGEVEAKISESWEKWLLDLVAIATVADMVPLVGENRALVYFGLKVLRRSPRAGLLQLGRALRLPTATISEEDIGFSIGPRLNSASRMSHANYAYELLTTRDVARAGEIVEHLELKNKERKTLVESIMEAAMAHPPAGGVVVVGNHTWPPGVLGLAASKLVETYQRPAFVWAKNGRGLIKGSCRSDGTLAVVDLMAAANSTHEIKHDEMLFANFGGHAMAGGFSLSEENLPHLEQALLDAHLDLPKTTATAGQAADFVLNLDEVTASLISTIETFGPFGMDHPKPLFLFNNVVPKTVAPFGATKNHLKLQFTKANGRDLSAIAFFALNPGGHSFGDFDLKPGRPLDLLATVEQSFFGGRAELRLRIVDIRPVG